MIMMVQIVKCSGAAVKVESSEIQAVPQNNTETADEQKEDIRTRARFLVKLNDYAISSGVANKQRFIVYYSKTQP